MSTEINTIKDEELENVVGGKKGDKPKNSGNEENAGNLHNNSVTGACIDPTLDLENTEINLKKYI